MLNLNNKDIAEIYKIDSNLRAHYWVETEDGFIIDAFTIGYSFDLRRKAEELTSDVDILVMNKNTKDKIEQQIIEGFYGGAVFYYELTQELCTGTKSAVKMTTEAWLENTIDALPNRTVQSAI